jgi:hypothetical protein
VPGIPSPAELKTVGDDSCSTLEEDEEDTMQLYVSVYDLLIAFSKFLTERHVHIRQQSESVGLSCPDLNLSILHIFKSMI